MSARLWLFRHGATDWSDKGWVNGWTDVYVQPSRRGAGVGRALLDQLIAAARLAGYDRVRLDSPEPYDGRPRPVPCQRVRRHRPVPESEIPDAYKPHWVFMERTLA
ncbi:MAG TPA: GNAT family N-acetyltransferase [Actinomycetota bacterium]|nr:GNAT family N-acetyltransferase [Actinomycetota bacterium]